MSLYVKHAQGAVEKTDFELSANNIDEYLKYAVDMDEEVRCVNAHIDLQYKLEHVNEMDDDLYTEEYLIARLDKLRKRRPIDELAQKVIDTKESLNAVNREIDVVKPLVFDAVEGTKPENHERMSLLDDKRKELEEAIAEIYAEKYPHLKEHMKKIFYMIVEGVNMDTVKSCFRQMRLVLVQGISTEEAASVLMSESEAQYNLPKGIYDPIRSGWQKKGKGGGKGKR